jgi:hypothetical protein
MPIMVAYQNLVPAVLIHEGKWVILIMLFHAYCNAISLEIHLFLQVLLVGDSN